MKETANIKSIIRKYIVPVIYKVCEAVIINILTLIILDYISQFYH